MSEDRVEVVWQSEWRDAKHDWGPPPNPSWDAMQCRACGKIASAAELSSTLYGGAQDCCPSTAGIVPPDA